jgi:hypothetical protein
VDEHVVPAERGAPGGLELRVEDVRQLFEETLERAYRLTAAPPDNLEEVAARDAEAAPRDGTEFFVEPAAVA